MGYQSVPHQAPYGDLASHISSTYPPAGGLSRRTRLYGSQILLIQNLFPSTFVSGSPFLTDMHLTAQPCPVYAVWTFLPSARFARSGKPVELNQVEERLSGIHVYSISNYINYESVGFRLCWINTISSKIKAFGLY